MQGLTALALLARRPAGAPRWLVLADLALVGVTVVATVLLAVPQHRLLGAGFDPAAHRSLVVTNWVRTAAWTGCAAAALALLGVREG